MSTIEINHEEFPVTILNAPKIKFLIPEKHPNLFVLDSSNESFDSLDDFEKETEKTFDSSDKSFDKLIIEKKNSSKNLNESECPTRTSSEDIVNDNEDILIFPEERCK